MLLLPLLLVIVLGFVSARDESYRAAEERVASLTRIAQLSQQRLIANVRQTLFVLAHAPAVVRGDTVQCSGTLRDVMLASIVYSNLGAADPQGNIICNAVPSQDVVSIADRGYFRQASELLDFGIGSYQIGRVTGKPGINFAYPVLDYRKKRVLRMIFGALDIAWLSTRLRTTFLPESGRAWVFDSDGVVLAGVPDESWVGRSVAGTALGQALQDAASETVVVEVVDLDGVQRLYGIAPVWEGEGGARLRVAVGIPVADAFVEVNRAFFIDMALLVTGAVVLFLLTFLLLRRTVLKPIDSLVAVAGRLAAQDRTARATVGTTIGEFAVLGSAFNDMADAIGNRERDLTRHLETVEQMSRRYEVLSAINQTIVHAEDEAIMLEAACAAIRRHGGGDFTWVTKFAADGTEHLLASAAAEDIRDPAPAMVQAGDAALRRQLLFGGTRVVTPLDDVVHVGPAIREALWPAGARQYIGYPILRSGAVYGALNIAAGENAIWLDAEGLALVREMAGDLGFALTSFDKDLEIRHLVYHDNLTGLANQIELIRSCDERIVQASGSGAMVPLIRIELLSLQQRIKRFGHGAGDFVVKGVADALVQGAPVGSLVARTGEQTFAVVLPAESDPQTLPKRVEALIDGMPTQLHFGAQEIGVQLNAGVASYPEDGETALALLQAGILALDSLGQGRSGAVAYYSARLSVEAQERWQIERHLARAIARQELFVHYQPTKDLATGRLRGVEALLRWKNPELGMVPPGRFIPIAEQAGMINDIGYWVFGETCRQVQAWAEAGVAPGYASVNVSVLQLYDPHFVAKVAMLFDRYPLSRDRIAVEITETAMMDDFDLSERVLGELKALGIAIFVDDFGTGYSSLSYLRRLPVDTLKIDLVFTSELATSEEALSVIKAILALGHSLGLSTLAEGIETAEQEQILADIGCDVGQGYYLGRPLPPEDIATLFRNAVDNLRH